MQKNLDEKVAKLHLQKLGAELSNLSNDRGKLYWSVKDGPLNQIIIDIVRYE